MKKLLEAWPALAAGLEGRRLLLLLDFDGTLAPIRARPESVALAGRVRARLARLAARPEVTLAIVSGRDFTDVRARVGLPNIIYSANHGGVIKGGGINYENILPHGKKAELARFARAAEKALAPVKGAWVERKKQSVVVHMRQVRRMAAPEAEKIISGLLAAEARTGLRARPGKKITEIFCCSGVNKGTAAAQILQRCGGCAAVLPVYIGDDTTDEDAFRFLRARGVTARVGLNGETAAEFRLAGVGEVYRFLRGI